MTAQEEQVAQISPFIIRLLNGPLQGCEYPLQVGRTLFVVGESSDFINGDVFPELPVDTLFIPLESGGVNFEVVVNLDVTEDEKVKLIEISDEKNSLVPVIFNTPIYVGNLMIAIRPDSLPWDCESFSSSKTECKSSLIKINNKVIYTIALLMLVVFAGFGGYWFVNTPQMQVAELDSLLGTEKNRFQVISGRNHVLFVIAKNEKDNLWARQVIARGDYDKKAQVIDYIQENKRISTWISDNYPTLAYYRLQLDNPRKPQFWISRQRTQLSTIELKKLNEKLMVILPYADSIDIVPMDDAIAARQAEAGLKLQALPYTRNNNDGGITFIIRGALDDGEILRAREFVDRYYHQWGDQYIQFAIELKDDWLKGRSFQYGTQGYVKMAPSHWYYPSPL